LLSYIVYLCTNPGFVPDLACLPPVPTSACLLDLLVYFHCTLLLLAVSSTTAGCTWGPRPGSSLLQVHPHHQGL
ncbi:unnamed protein product, partial [Staurois parvus]